MPRAIRLYVHYVEAVNRVVGRFAMYMIFAMLALLLYPPLKKFCFLIVTLVFGRDGAVYDVVAPYLYPPIWSLEMAQFSMAAYYLLGGGYSMQLDAHVRMDLLYGRWRPRRQNFIDSITAFCLVVYLSLLLFGGFSSTGYALQYKEVSYSSWAPYMAPIKIVMTFGIILMLLQAIAIFFRDLAGARGLTIDGEPLPAEGAA